MELLDFMQQYIQIDTSHPKPRYKEVFDLFKAQAKEVCFDYQIIRLESGLEVMVISVPGADENLPSLALNHHTDVVPVNDEQWSVPSFEGIIENGLIYGRGTQDMKGVGVCHYFALRQLLKENVSLNRSVHIILLPHEEVGGFAGGGFFVNNDLFKQLNIGYVLDEGLPSGKDDRLLIKVSERKPMQISFVSRGKMAHGSRMAANNAIYELVLFLGKMANFQKEQKVLAKSQESGLLLSMNATSFQAGVIKNGRVALNIVPEDAEATVDVRVPPTMHKREALEKIHEMMKEFPGISYEIKTQAGERLFEDNYETDFYRELASVIKAKDIAVERYYAEESSDMRFYLEKGVIGLGLSPFTIEENLHGIDEAIKVSDLELGQDIFYQFLKKFCL